MSRRILVILLVLAGLVLSGCRARSKPLVVGTKSFTEQAVLGELLAELLRSDGRRVQIRNCGDTWSCQQGLRSGQLDLMVDYTGTGLRFAGATVTDTDASLERVQALYEPLGIRWKVPLGFDNGYLVLVPHGRALGDGLKTIADLAKIPGGIRVACPDTYRRRPGDGLGALLDRYGITLATAPVILDDPEARYQALLTGQVDMAIGYGTDGALADLGLTALNDSLRFFPAYTATIVMSAEVDDAQPDLAKALAPLAGAIDVQRMRELNHEVDVLGRSAKATARRLLAELDLVDDAAATPGKVLVVAGDAADSLDAFSPRAVRAVRQVFTKQTAVFEPTADAYAAVVGGQARLAILGAEQLFSPEPPLRRLESLHALAVLGSRQVHVIRRQGDAGPALSGKLGVEEAATGSGRIGAEILRVSGAKVTTRAPAAALVEAVRSKSLDAAIVATSPGGAIATALVGPGVQLVSLQDWLTSERATALPWLRPSRIPAATYATQPEPIDTLAVQVVLAGPGPSMGGPSGAGPAGAIGAVASPLSRDEVRSLTDATGILETPNPALPSAWSVTGETVRASGSGSPWNTPLNMFVVVFLMVCGRLATSPVDQSSR